MIQIWGGGGGNSDLGVDSDLGGDSNLGGDSDLRVIQI